MMLGKGGRKKSIQAQYIENHDTIGFLLLMMKGDLLGAVRRAG